MTRAARRTLVRVVAAVTTALCLAAAGCSDDAPSSPSSTPEVRLAKSADIKLSPTTVERLKSAHVFFGHQSVGQSLIDALAAHPPAGAPLNLQRVDDGAQAWPQGGELRHALVGENEHPESKIKAFEEMMERGPGRGADVALFKLCFVDFDADTDADALFAQYKASMAKLEAAHPETTFLVATAPLTVRGSAVRHALSKLQGKPTFDDVNAIRERFNHLLRQSFPAKRVFDLAALEAGCGEGGFIAGRPAALAKECTTDGGHLTEDAAHRVALYLLEVVDEALQERAAGPTR